MVLAEGGVETPSFLPFLGGVECPRPDRHTLGPPTPKEEELGVPHPISGAQKGSWQEGVWATELLNWAGRPGGRGARKGKSGAGSRGAKDGSGLSGSPGGGGGL